ncbi:YfcZ/YiiS family protein [Gilliamella sp. BG7]|uniref:YfcZ/YiiS family protein n=1 Tax=unclassified Gilliamella TaxID=2685620 RepID=UPI0039882B48
MADSLNKCKANETPACCCVDVGTIIDNEDCSAEYEHIFATESEAQAKLASLTQAANDVATEPCEINSNIDKISDGFKLSAKFTFCCGAESMIFQLKLR